MEYEMKQAEMEALVARANQLPDLDTEPLETQFRCALLLTDSRVLGSGLPNLAIQPD